ncbi:putative lipid II flippase FtsW [Ornithinibacillus gellani]|uniref:putative lipid II flippase FtsW n=1 Tax=Ornithinibacillus gellani TaxID=2293253 RepID=UPI000F48C235|nr:putative lipid II flippase FtsW [Ornithinibacillus gellani]TQS75688.1 putative lipid II flippase FtsW [Ornithinibacillus gellani]
MIRKLKNYDFTLMITPILLAAFGIVMIYSASMVVAVVNGNEPTFYLVRQLRSFVIGMVGFVITCIIPYKTYQKLVKLISLVMIGMLVYVLINGHSEGNATRWFSLGPMTIQPSEFVKIGLIIYLASVYSKKQEYISDFGKAVLPPLVLMGIILALILKQPDVGTAATILLIGSTIIFSSGIRFRHLFLLSAVGVIVVAIAIPNMVTETRIERFTGAYQPFEAPDDGGHHLIQSYLAISGGGLSGEGLGQSVQKLGYLFGAHTDFIMSIVAEELGFIGVFIVIGMLAIIVLRGFFIARKCEDSFGALMAIGISAMVGIQASINLGAISGILPITGVTLPFISYGGSSLMVLLISMGILNNIAMQTKKDEADVQPKESVTKPVMLKQRGGRSWSS